MQKRDLIVTFCSEAFSNFHIGSSLRTVEYVLSSESKYIVCYVWLSFCPSNAKEKGQEIETEKSSW